MRMRTGADRSMLRLSICLSVVFRTVPVLTVGFGAYAVVVYHGYEMVKLQARFGSTSGGRDQNPHKQECARRVVRRNYAPTHRAEFARCDRIKSQTRVRPRSPGPLALDTSLCARQLAYPGRTYRTVFLSWRSGGKDEVRRIAANIAKLPEHDLTCS
jgi:hypothetical protein